jgi:hemerythrin superfamily protein
MDVIRLLESDHRRVEELFTRAAQRTGDERMIVLGQLNRALHDHMDLEESILYPVMEAGPERHSVQEAETEHELARQALAAALARAPGGLGFGAALDAARAMVAHHVAEEERTLFPHLRAHPEVLTRLEPTVLEARAARGLPNDDRVAPVERPPVAPADSRLADEVAAAMGFD